MIVVQITDDADAVATMEMAAQISNLAPSASISGPEAGNVNDPVTFELSADDPSPTDMQAEFTYHIDWDGDGEVDQTIVGPATGVQVDHSYETAGDYTIVVTATDKDGDTGPAAQHTVTIIDEGTCFIGGYVYLDVNDNGIMDAPELALPNVPVTLTGQAERTVLTDANGWYEFRDLPPGQYDVLETQPSAFLDGKDTPGEPVYGHVANDMFYEMQLPSRTVAMYYNFGEMGLIPELVSKKLFLASTPNGDQLLSTISAENGAGWFTFSADTEGELIVSLDQTIEGLTAELYTSHMLPVALSRGEHLMVATVEQGEDYVLHIAGDTGGGELYANLDIKPRSQVTTSGDYVLDVNGDGWISPFDALLVINHLNAAANAVILSQQQEYALDVNADEIVSPLDALLVINYLNNRGTGEGESSDNSLTSADGDSAQTDSVSRGTKFYVVDAAADATFRYAADGTGNGQFGIHDVVTDPRGATSNVAGDRVWVVDGTSRQVAVIGPDGDFLGSWLAAETQQPEGIATDGTDIWIVDADLLSVLRYAEAASMEFESPQASSFTLQVDNNSPTGLATDGSTLWVTDDVADEVFVYDTNGTWLGRWALDSENRDPSGITNDPSGSDDLWVVDRDDDLVYRYSSAARLKHGGAEATDTFELIATNRHPEGIADPPDLSISDVNTADLIYDGQLLSVSGEISAAVTNIGTEDTSQTFDVLFFEDLNLDGTFNELADVVLGSTTVTDSLPVNGTVTVTAPLSGPVKFTENVVWGFVDSSDSVVEVSEANNLARRGSVVAPRPGEFEPQIEWIKSEFSVRPESNQVWMTPAVIDLNGDEIPDIVFSSGPNYTQDATLRAVSGADGSELWSVIDPANELEPGTGVAVGDIDLDGFPEVIAVHETGAILAFEHDGVFKWKSPVVDGLRYHGSPSIAQMDGSGTPEIVVGDAVIDASGNIRWRGSSAGAEGYGANTGYSSLSVVADLDLDGLPEIVAGKSALHHDGALYWNSSITDGFPGIGNFDADDNPEIVVVASGKVYLLEHTGDVKWGPITIPGGGSGGPPTIADVDGDNQPEIGVAGAERYVVLETDGSVKWTSVTVDNSSNMTGSSVFDFEGDGGAEIVYADEWYLRIFRGVDGQVLYELPKSSGTLWEYPLVVDVDADGNAEIVAVANDVLWGSEHGIYVIGDANDNWVPTRQIWNQHTYHITNVNDDGTIPIHEQNSWETHNTYRLNLQGEIGDPIPAPDLTASYIQVRPDREWRQSSSARFGNGGSLFVAPGINNAFYDGDPEKGGQLLGTLSTTRRLEPGQYEDLSISLSQLPVNEIWVVADDDGSGKGSVSESDELNNIHHVQVEFVTPAVKIVSPKNGSEQSLGQNTLITGHVVAATDIGSAFARTLNRIVLVTVDGRPVDALDSSGNFFASVSLLPGANSYEFMATDAFGQTASTTLTLYGTQASPGEQEFSLVSDVTASFFAEYGRTSFHEDTDILYADVAIRNAGQYLADTPLLVGITNISKPSVRVREPDGVTPEGIPYFDYTDLVADGTLHPGESTGQRVLSFFNPERVQFTYDLVFFGQLNQAPAITTVPNIEALVGRPYRYDVDAVDPDEDPVSFTLLAGPYGSTIDPTTGQITLSPISDHLGNHAVVVRVEDGRGGSSRAALHTVGHRTATQSPAVLHVGAGGRCVREPAVLLRRRRC